MLTCNQCILQYFYKNNHLKYIKHTDRQKAGQCQELYRYNKRFWVVFFPGWHEWEGKCGFLGGVPL